MFKNLKVTCIKAEGKCRRTRCGDNFVIRNAKLEIPPGQSVCIFALGSNELKGCEEGFKRGFALGKDSFWISMP